MTCCAISWCENHIEGPGKAYCWEHRPPRGAGVADGPTLDGKPFDDLAVAPGFEMITLDYLQAQPADFHTTRAARGKVCPICHKHARYCGHTHTEMVVWFHAQSKIEAHVKGVLPPAAETRVTDPKTGGQKGVKLERFDLLPWEPLTALSRLYGKGALKYEPDNWRRGYAWRLSLGAMLRHVALWAVGKSWDTADGTKDGPCDVDAEGKPIHTGEHHLTCVAWHCFTLYVFETQNLGTDDRQRSA